MQFYFINSAIRSSPTSAIVSIRSSSTSQFYQRQFYFIHSAIKCSNISSIVQSELVILREQFQSQVVLLHLQCKQMWFYLGNSSYQRQLYFINSYYQRQSTPSIFLITGSCTTFVVLSDVVLLNDSAIRGSSSSTIVPIDQRQFYFIHSAIRCSSTS